MKVFVVCLFLLSLGFALSSKNRHSFSTMDLYSPLSFDSRWEIEEVSSVEPMLNQKFHYLGSGAQMVAFLGEDQKTVLKFFKMNCLLPKQWLFYFPLPSMLHPYRKRKTVDRKRKLERVFQSVKLARERLSEETGLLYANLNPVHKWKQTVTLVDKQKKEHVLLLSNTPFVLQQRAELIFDRLRRLSQEECKPVLQNAVEQVLTLIQRRVEKGVLDKDSGVSANYGFVGDRAIQIDIGGFYLSNDENPSDAQVEHVRTKIYCRGFRRQG